MNFIQLNHTDIPAIIPLVKHLGNDLSDGELKLFFKQMFLMDNYHCFGWEEDGVLLALSSVWISLRLYSGKQAEIDNFIVHPEAQGKGIGKKFLNALEKWALSENCLNLELNTYTQNRRSHKFYYREGYEIFGFHFIKKLT